MNTKPKTNFLAMRKYLTIVIVLFFIGAGASLTKLWVKSPESVRIFSGYASSSESVKPTLPRVIVRVVGFVKPTLPKVIAPSSMEEMLMAAREKRRLEDERLCEEYNQEYSGVGRPTIIKCNITTFAGSGDTGVTSTETGSVNLERLRSANINDLVTAWPMPEMNENNPDSPWNLPSVEEHFGKGHPNIKKRIEFANIALRDYYAEISYYDPESKIVKKVYAKIGDRGPNVEKFKKLPRWDAYLGVWKAVGVEDKLKNPNSKEFQIELSVRLVHKDKVDTERKEELFTQVTPEDARRFYGPQDEFEEEQFSTNESEKFALPSWDSEDRTTTIASNP